MIPVNFIRETALKRECWTILCYTHVTKSKTEMRIVRELYTKDERANVKGEFVQTVRKESYQRIPPLPDGGEREIKERICAEIMKLKVR